MGLFNFISSSINNAKQAAEEARLKAVNSGDPHIVVHMLKRASGYAELSGYSAGLRDLLRDEDLYVLKELYREAFEECNINALKALRPAFSDKGYEILDDNGRWIHPDRL